MNNTFGYPENTQFSPLEIIRLTHNFQNVPKSSEREFTISSEYDCEIHDSPVRYKKPTDPVIAPRSASVSAHDVSRLMRLTWRNKKSADFSQFPLTSDSPHEQRMLSHSLSPRRSPMDNKLRSVPITESLLELMDQVSRNRRSSSIVSRNTTASSFGSRKSFLSVHSEPERVEHDSPRIRQFHSKLNSMAQKGLHQEILQQIDSAADIEANTRTYTILVKAMCRANQIDKATELIFNMEKWPIHKQPNRFTYNTLLNGMVRKRMIKQALDLFSHMLDLREDQQPDQVTFSTVIKGHTLEGDMLSAELLFNEMKLLFDANHVTCNTMVKGYSSVGDMDKAFEFFNDMLEHRNGLASPDQVTMNTLIDGFAKHSQIDKAELVFNQMKAMSVNDHTLAPNQITFNTLIDGYTKCGEMAKAESLFEMMEQHKTFKVTPATYASMIGGYNSVNEFAKAERLFQDLKTHKDPQCRPNQVVYATMIECYCSSEFKQLEKAKSLFEEMKNSKTHALKPTLLTFTVLIEGLVRLGDMDYAEKVFSTLSILKSGFSPNQAILSAMIQGYHKSNKKEKAIALTHKAQQF